MADQKVLNFCNPTKEVWKDIPDTEGFYQVSNKGRVYSVRSKKIMKTHISCSGKGYKALNISINGNRNKISIHRTVAEAFIPNPGNKPQINHKDGDKLNNHVSNLEWCTRKENGAHASENGLIAHGERSGVSKLSTIDVLDIRNAYRIGCFTHKEIAKAYGICRTLVTLIINKKRWKHL